MTKLTAAQLGERIGKSENWVKRHARNLPHHRFGKTYIFTDDDLAEILLSAARKPGSSKSADEFAPVGGRNRKSA